MMIRAHLFVCGGDSFVDNAVLWDELAAQWQLSPNDSASILTGSREHTVLLVARTAFDRAVRRDSDGRWKSIAGIYQVRRGKQASLHSRNQRSRNPEPYIASPSGSSPGGISGR